MEENLQPGKWRPCSTVVAYGPYFVHYVFFPPSNLKARILYYGVKNNSFLRRAQIARDWVRLRINGDDVQPCPRILLFYFIPRDWGGLTKFLVSFSFVLHDHFPFVLHDRFSSGRRLSSLLSSPPPFLSLPLTEGETNDFPANTVEHSIGRVEVNTYQLPHKNGGKSISHLTGQHDPSCLPVTS